MHLTVRRGATSVDVVVHPSRPGATLAHLVAAATGAPPPGPADAVVVDGRTVPASTPLHRAGLADGSVVHCGPDAPAVIPDTTPGGGHRHEVWVTGGLTAGRWMPLRPGSQSLGRNHRVPGPDAATVSATHAEVVLTPSGEVTVADRSSRNGTWAGDLPVGPDAVPLPRHRPVRLGAVEVTVRTVPDRRSAPAPPAPGRPTAAWSRRPRPAPDPPLPPLVTPRAPEPRPGPAPIGVAATVAPALMGLVLVVALGSWLYGLFALLSPVVAVATSVETRRRQRRGGRRDRVAFERAVATFETALRRAHGQALDRLHHELPDPADVARRAATADARLWERRPTHADWLHLRLGTGPVRWTPSLAADPDPQVRAALDAHDTLPDAPVGLDLSGGAVVGVVGPRRAALAVARSLVLQAAVHHGPADLDMAVLASAAHAPDWGWTKWLPHLRPPGLPARHAADPDTADEVLRRFVEQHTDRGDAAVTPTLLVVLDDDGLARGRRGTARAVLGGAAGPVAGIVVATDADRLPAACTSVVELAGPDGAARLVTHRDGSRQDSVLAAGVPPDVAVSAARALARLDDPDLAGGRARLPPDVSLLDLLDLDPPHPDRVADRWDTDGPAADLVVPLGVGTDGVVSVDLVRDGPHALVAGTTGAGKSELLRSLVAGLAAAAPPDQVTFLLVDFKGGSAFDRCTRLPHTVGVVTDLDPPGAARALRSLHAEVRHREEQLRTTGVGDLAAYRLLQQRDPAVPPLPRLVVVVDEFATLVAEVPGFVDALVGVAQRGRSLGVHLVLATQRPAGAVSERIRANTDLRIALRVQDATDSDDVIGAPDAARIDRSTPGRAIARFGPGHLVELQTALATAPVARGAAPAATVSPFRFGGPTGPGTVAGAHRGPGPGSGTGLDALVAAASAAWASRDGSTPRRPYLPPLPASLGLDQVWDQAGDHLALVPVALADDPDHQARHVVGWRPADGTLLLAGLPGSGTTTAAASTVLALTRATSPADLHVYVMDAGAGGLAPLAELPHVGAVVGPGERERAERLLARLAARVRARLAGHEGTHPTLVLVLDGLGAVRAAFDDVLDGPMADLERILADGPAVGVRTVLTADRAAVVPSAALARIRQRWQFRTADPVEWSALGLRAADVPDLPPGGAVLVEQGWQVQVGRPAPDLTRAVRSVAARWPHQGAGPEPVGVLPATVPLASMPPARALARGWHVPLGVADHDLGPVGVDLPPGGHLLVAGPPRSGRTTALAVAARAFAEAARPPTLVLVADPDCASAALLRRVTADRIHVVDPRRTTAFGELEELVAGSADPAVVLVDDVDRLPGADALLGPLLVPGGPHVVVAGRNDVLRTQFSEWLREVRAARVSLLLQADADLDTDLAGVPLPRHTRRAGAPGRGWLVQEGGPRLVQVASGETS